MSSALKLLLAYLFEHTVLNKVYAQTGAFNLNSIYLLESLGFHQDGRLREHHELNGVFYDDFIYSMLSSDYYKIKNLKNTSKV